MSGSGSGSGNSVSGSGKRILIAEDSAILATHLAAAVQDLGYEVVGVVASADDAVSVTCRERPDLVLMDIVLRSEADGLEAIRKIQEQCPTPVVVLSAFDTEAYLTKARDAGACAYLCKPASESDLARAMVIAMARHQDIMQLRHEVARRQEVERELKAERDRARRYLEITPSMILALDANGDITLLNRSGRRVLECGADVIGKSWVETFIPEDARDTVRAVFRDIMAGKIQPYEQHENEVVTARGSLRLIHWYNRLIEDASGTIIGTLSSGEDITEQREMEQRLRYAEKMDAIGNLAGGVAHDFNNQLAVILGFADLLENSLTDKELAGYATSISRATERAGDLTQQLLAFSRRGQYRKTAVDLHESIQEVISLLDRSIDKRITVGCQLTAETASVLGDPTQLHSALLNLGVNAKDAMPDGGELLFLTTVVTVEHDLHGVVPPIAPGRYLRIEVHDTGIGMDEATLQRIFEPFFSTKPKGQGTGMGLAAVYGTISRHGGGLSVESEPGRGSAFSLYLPLLEVVAGEEPVSEAPQDRAPQQDRPRHVMVVDDEELVRVMLARMLRRLGYEATDFASGEKALAYFQGSWSVIDLVVLDMTMPGISGAELFRAIRAVNPEVKVLIATGHSSESEAQRLLDAGANGFIQKPFRMATLRMALDKALRS